jgi:hypothetical protein
MSNWRKFWQLPPSERVLFVSSVLMLLITALALRFIGFNRWHSFLSRSRVEGKHKEAQPANSIEQARAVARMVRLASKHGFYRANCLQCSITLWWLLRRRGVESDIQIGVRKDIEGFQAHAWIEYQGIVLNDVEDIFSSFVRFDRPVARLRSKN